MYFYFNNTTGSTPPQSSASARPARDWTDGAVRGTTDVPRQFRPRQTNRSARQRKSTSPRRKTDGISHQWLPNSIEAPRSAVTFRLASCCHPKCWAATFFVTLPEHGQRIKNRCHSLLDILGPLTRIPDTTTKTCTTFTIRPKTSLRLLGPTRMDQCKLWKQGVLECLAKFQSSSRAFTRWGTTYKINAHHFSFPTKQGSRPDCDETQNILKFSEKSQLSFNI